MPGKWTSNKLALWKRNKQALHCIALSTAIPVIACVFKQCTTQITLLLKYRRSDKHTAHTFTSTTGYYVNGCKFWFIA